MEYLDVNRNFDNKQELLLPMMDILDKKNITTGVFSLEENEKFYLGFDKDKAITVYDVARELIKKGIKDSLRHLFSSKD